MNDKKLELSQLIGAAYSTGKKIRVITILGEFVGSVCARGGRSTYTGLGGINDSFQIRDDKDAISDVIHLDHVLSIDGN